VSGSIDDFLGGYQPPRVTVFVTMRADLLARHAELKHAHQLAVRDDLQQNRDPQAPGILDELRTVETELAESEFPFTFEALGRHQYMKVKAQHPARKQDRSARLDFNEETFPAALIAASAVEPAMEPEQAVELVDRLSDGQFVKLWNAAISVNVGADDVPKSVLRSDTAASNGTSSTTASPEESPDPSSSDES